MSYNAAREANAAKIDALPAKLKPVAREVCHVGDWNQWSAHDSLAELVNNGEPLTDEECELIMSCFEGGYWD